MENHLNLNELYDKKLSGKEYKIQMEEIGGNSKLITMQVKFEPHNKKHLIGENSKWAKEKRNVFVRLCDFKDTVKMVGVYDPNTGDLNLPDMLIGTIHGCFGLVECEDKKYRPTTCMETDMRNRCFKPLLKIKSVEQVL